MVNARTERMLQFLFLLGFILVTDGCVKPFVPPANNAVTGYLVVDGIILGNGVRTNIRLSRSRNLGDSSQNSPEAGATVQIDDENGSSVQLTEGSNGIYFTDALFTSTGHYRLKIFSAGRDYTSDLVVIKETPLIDSVSWEQRGDVHIFVSTHDPSNQTHYYRWNYTETSEYHSAFESHLDFIDGKIIFLEPEAYKSVCYQDFESARIIIGNSSALSSDLINRQPITIVPNDNSKISVRYSIIVRQFALPVEAYEYWRLLNQNNEATGGLFDPQPALLMGNIHCLQDAGEPVVGFISGATLQEKRIFIRHSELPDRIPVMEANCLPVNIHPDSAVFQLNRNPDDRPGYFTTGPPPGLAIVPRKCVDCTVRGGVITKPLFW